MDYRRLGKSDLELPVVSFGAWAIGGWMWDGTDDGAAVRAIHKAIDVGMTCIDTAPMYGMGHSEIIVGKAIAGRRDRAIIATKCGLRWDLEEGEPYFSFSGESGKQVNVYRNLRPHSIKYECEQSLKRMGISEIDLYQCHWPDSTTDLDDTMAALLDLQQEGKIRAIGVSNFTPDMMAQCLKRGPVASLQSKYNALERELEQAEIPFCIEHGLGVLPYSPIAQGLLTGKVTMNRTFEGDDGRKNHPWFQPQNRSRALDMLCRVQPIADSHGVSLGQLFINWIISQPGVTSALVGARNEAQVEENAGAALCKLTDDELATIRKEVEALGTPL